jgi:hypothetical protein
MLNRVLGEFGLATQNMVRAAHSQSPAGVHRVRTATGRDAYLKTTPAELGPEAVLAARREVRFYRELASGLACRTPELLASYDAEDGIAVLLASAGRAKVPQSWSPSMWAACGGRLALLHTTPLPPGEDWHRPDPLLRAMAEPVLESITACWAQVLPELPRILSSADELVSHGSLRPAVFTHGDCHTGNIVFLGEHPAFCDWQAAVVGRAASDLAFLSVRATPLRVAVPPDLVTAYLDHANGDREELERALIAEELAVFVFQWPHFSHLNAPAAVAHVRRRVRFLASRWLSDLN